MPLLTRPPCPGCGRRLDRKPAGRCPACGADVAAYVSATRDREERIERVAGIVATVLVVSLFAATAGLGFLEGVAAYAVAGALVWFLSKGAGLPR